MCIFVYRKPIIKPMQVSMCKDQDDSTESNNNFLSKLQRKIFMYKTCIFVYWKRIIKSVCKVQRNHINVLKRVHLFILWQRFITKLKFIVKYYN